MGLSSLNFFAHFTHTNIHMTSFALLVLFWCGEWFLFFGTKRARERERER